MVAVPFIGRSAELAALNRAWQRTRDGHGCVVGLTGGSGMGKTALLQRFLNESNPMRVVATGLQAENTESWWLFRQMATALLALTGGSGEWADPHVDAKPSHVGKSFLDEIRTVQPIVLAIDDLQFADKQSRDVVGHITRRLAQSSILMILVFNEGHAISGSWLQLFQPPLGSLLKLAGLTPPELALLGLPPAAAARLHAHTDGSPILVSNLFDQGLRHKIVTGQGPLPAPRSIAELVATNLAACAEPTRRLMAAAAVLGPTFNSAVAADLAGLEDATPFLAEAVRAGLIQETSAPAKQWFTFRHALTHQAVYESIDLVFRRDLHRRAAMVPGLRDALHHRIAIADGTDPDLAAELDQQADLETVQGELAAAAGHREAALARTAPGPEHDRRLLWVVEAHLIAGNASAANGYGGELAARGGDPWWDYVAGYQMLLASWVPDARLRLNRALEAIDAGIVTPGAPADLRARISTQLAIIALVSLSYDEMVKYGQDAAKAGSDDRRVQAFAWFARTVGLALAGKGEQALQELSARGQSADLDVLVARGITELWMDDLDGACRHLTEALDRAYQGEPLRIGQALGFLGDAEYRCGRLDHSARHLESAVEDAKENLRVWDYGLLHGLACQTHAARGEWAQAQHHAQAAAQAATEWVRITGTRAAQLAAAGAQAVIAQAYEDKPGLLTAAERVDVLLDSPEPGLTLLGPIKAEALVQLGHTEQAELALDAFTTRYGPTRRKSALMGIARVRGQIAAARGAHRDALAEYSRALDLADAVGLPLEAGRIEMLIGECLFAYGRKIGAGLRLRAAVRCFSRIGANAYAAQAMRRISGLGLTSTEPEEKPVASLDYVLANIKPDDQKLAKLISENKNVSHEVIRAKISIGDKSLEGHLREFYHQLGLEGRTKRAALHRLLNGPPRLG